MAGSRKILTPGQLKGSRDLKMLERTTASVYQSRPATRSGRHLKHAHALAASRDVRRVDRREWEARVGAVLRLYEKHRWEKANSLYNAMSRVHGLLSEATVREAALQQTTDELEETGAYLQTLMDSMADILIVTDPYGVITEANRAAARLSGFETDELIGRRFRDCFVETDAARQGIRDVVQHGDVSNRELTLLCDGRSPLPVIYNATPLLSADDLVEGVLINARDMSDLKAAQEALVHKADELARANADLEEFAAVASHDLQEPLKKVGIYAQSVVDRFDDDAEADPTMLREMRYIAKQAIHMQELIQNVLVYAQTDAVVAYRVLDTNRLFAQALDNVVGALETTPVVITCDSLPTVRANGPQLMRVFQNLLGNGIKYSDYDKPEATIHVGACRLEHSPYELHPDAPEHGWLFWVVDNGIGIHEEFQEDVFKMFVRLHTDEISGAGMGLAITRKIVLRHGGAIWFESEVGVGTTMLVALPED